MGRGADRTTAAAAPRAHRALPLPREMTRRSPEPHGHRAGTLRRLSACMLAVLGVAAPSARAAPGPQVVLGLGSNPDYCGDPLTVRSVSVDVSSGAMCRV